MKHILTFVLTIGILAGLLLALPLSANAAQSANVTATCEPEALAVGEKLTVTVVTREMTVSSFTCGLVFDPALVKVTAVTGYDLAISGGGSWKPIVISTPEQANQTGRVGFAYANSQNRTYAAGILAEITLEAIGQGQAAFTLYEDSDGADGTVSSDAHSFTCRISEETVTPPEDGDEPTAPTEDEEPTAPTEDEEPTAPTEDEEPTVPPTEDDRPAVNPFVDVFEVDYYYDPVLWAVENGITNGMDATHFAPDGTCTRAQIVTFLWRSKGSPAPATSDNPFADVPAGQWYTDAVLWAVGEGITTGTSATTFSPDAGCTRGQVATFLWRSEGQPASGGDNIFTDITSGVYYYDAVLWAVENGITNGMGNGLFAPEATCTRGQIVTFLYRAMA